MRILVTGGCGFIGSHLVDKLVSTGNEVIIVDNKENNRNEKAKYYIYSILNQEKLDSIMNGIDIVYHLAALTSVKESNELPKKYLETNAMGSLSVLESARKNDVKKVIFTSTSAIYGASKGRLRESHSTAPISVYGATKLAADNLLNIYCKNYSLSGASAVLGNIYGPRSKMGVMHDLYEKIKANKNELAIIGDGMQKKQYLYISDCIKALELLAGIKGYERINISSSKSATVKKIADDICEIVGAKPNYKFTGKSWVGDVQKFELDISKIKKRGWEEEIELKEGIKRYVAWLS